MLDDTRVQRRMLVIICGLDDAECGDSREESRTVRFLLIVFPPQIHSTGRDNLVSIEVHLDTRDSSCNLSVHRGTRPLHRSELPAHRKTRHALIVSLHCVSSSRCQGCSERHRANSDVDFGASANVSIGIEADLSSFQFCFWRAHRDMR